MIESITQIVESIKNYRLAEIEQWLNNNPINHRPTNGDIYEGLTNEMLEEALKNSPIKVTNGFVKNYRTGKTNEAYSHQTDIIIYYGDAEKIPCTNSNVVNIDDTLAVIEVKGTLADSELKDFHAKQKCIYDLIDEVSKFDDSFYDISKLVFGKIVNEDNYADDTEKYLYNFLKCDNASPLRIQIGYDGFKKEETLRNHFMELISTTTIKNGPGSLPNLILSDQGAIIKLFGTPYTTALHENIFMLYGSTNNPIRLLLESIYSKVLGRLGLVIKKDDYKSIDLNMFLMATYDSTKNGWIYKEVPLVKKKEVVLSEWEPYYCSKEEYLLVESLCNGRQFRKYSLFLNKKVEDLAKNLLDHRIVGFDGTKVILLTKNCKCIITPNGDYVVGEDFNGQFTNWIASKNG